MTGYGRVNLPFRDKTIVAEIRSLNSKYTDLRIKVPQNYREKELDIRKMITDKAQRGKLDFNLELRGLQGDDEYSLNVPLFKKYYRELSTLQFELKLGEVDLMQSILRLPNVVVTADDSLDPEEWQAVKQAIEQALQAFNDYRRSEGQAMEGDLRMRVQLIRAGIDDLSAFEQERVEKLRQRLQQNLEENLGKDKIDENRFEQEILFYLEKMDITEEKVRLKQHCDYFHEVLDQKESIKGRKLSFISQEMGREINTIGSKAGDTVISALVVQLKADLERFREQVQNIE